MLNVPAMKEAKAEIPRAAPARPLTGHLIAVEAGDDGRSFSRDIQQDRSGRAAVHGAVANAREHDDGGDRIEREGGRQEQRDGRRRTDPGKHADQGSHGDADEAVEKVLRLQRDVKAVEQGSLETQA